MQSVAIENDSIRINEDEIKNISEVINHEKIYYYMMIPALCGKI